MAYADFSLRHPDMLKIVGVADPDKYRQKMVSEKFGFCDQFYFARWFKDKFDMSPRDYRKSTLI